MSLSNLAKKSSAINMARVLWFMWTTSPRKITSRKTRVTTKVGLCKVIRITIRELKLTSARVATAR